MNAGGGIEELAFDAGTEEDFKKKRDSRIQFYKKYQDNGKRNFGSAFWKEKMFTFPNKLEIGL